MASGDWKIEGKNLYGVLDISNHFQKKLKQQWHKFYDNFQNTKIVGWTLRKMRKNAYKKLIP